MPNKSEALKNTHASFFPKNLVGDKRGEMLHNKYYHHEDGQTRARERAPVETNTNFTRHQRWEFDTVKS